MSVIMVYDEIWSVKAQRISDYFSAEDHGGCEIKIEALPDRRQGSLSFFQTRVVISGENAETVHDKFFKNFLSGGA